MSPRMGLFGFGRAGRAVASVLLNRRATRWEGVVREGALVHEGNYTGRVFVIDCLPFLVQETPEHRWEYWAFLTDATGFGWDEEHPVRLISDRPFDLSPERDRIRVLATLSADSAGWLPLFRVLSAYAHEASERALAPPSETH